MNRFDRFVLVEFALDAEFCVADGNAARAKRVRTESQDWTRFISTRNLVSRIFSMAR